MKNEKTTIESRVADTILENPVSKVTIDGTDYDIAPPTIATLILISKYISQLPIVEKVKGAAVVNSVLHHAKDFSLLGDIAAVMILGANNLTEKRTITITNKKWFGLRKTKEERTVTVDAKSILADKILKTMSPTELQNLVMSRINDLDIPSFFVLTTSLTEANLLKPTREVG